MICFRASSSEYILPNVFSGRGSYTYKKLSRIKKMVNPSGTFLKSDCITVIKLVIKKIYNLDWNLCRKSVLIGPILNIKSFSQEHKLKMHQEYSLVDILSLVLSNNWWIFFVICDESHIIIMPKNIWIWRMLSHKCTP